MYIRAQVALLFKTYSMKNILFISAFLIIAAIPSAQQAPAGHNILSSQLPAVLLKDIKKEYKGY
jgi:hypothetical protein